MFAEISAKIGRSSKKIIVNAAPFCQGSHVRFQLCNNEKNKIISKAFSLPGAGPSLLPGMNKEKVTYTVKCHVTCNTENGVAEVRADNWPQRLFMQLIPKNFVQTIGKLLSPPNFVAAVLLRTPCSNLAHALSYLKSCSLGLSHLAEIRDLSSVPP